MGRKGYKTLTLLFCCWLVSCVKDKPPTQNNTTPGATGNVYVVCEGNFGVGDGTLYAYHPVHDSVFGDLYNAVNHQPLGDVFQSMKRIGNRFFLCINNSDKVVVISADNWQLEGVINIPKPRYILPVSVTKAYVSALYSNKVYVIDPQALQVTGIIELPNNNPEGMLLHNGNAVICTWDTSAKNVFSIDVNTDKIIQTFKTAGYAPQEALVDKEQMLWILSGNATENKPAAWTRIDPSTGNILKTFVFPDNADAIRPVFNNTRDTLYFIEANYTGGAANNGIYRMGINEQVLPAQPFIVPQPLQYFWALGIDPATGDIYVGDPKGFTQKGTVYIYRPDGAMTGSFDVGLGPGHFYFDE